jgi:hypothetical protein
MAKQQTAEVAFSPRSQTSLQREAKLRQNLENVENEMAYAQKNLTEETQSRERFGKRIAEGEKDGLIVLNLDRCLFEIKGLAARLEILGELKKNIGANIEAECVIPPDRAGVQAALAETARRRLDQARQIEDLLETLRAALSKRDALTSEMKGLAERIEFSGDFDERRFASLREALVRVLPESEHWQNWFLGTAADTKLYVVRDEFLVLPETLKSPGIYHFGDTVELSEDQAQELVRENRIVSVEEDQTAVAVAGEKGISVIDFLFWREIGPELEIVQPATPARDMDEVRGLEAERTARRERLTKKLREKAGHFRDGKLRITARVRYNIQMDGRSYKEGDIFEIALKDAWQLLEAGAVEAPWAPGS